MTDYIISEERIKFLEALAWRGGEIWELRERPLEAELQKERERVLDKIVKRSNEQSESAELPCQDGWHTGDHPTEVIRISYLKSEIESIRGEP